VQVFGWSSQPRHSAHISKMACFLPYFSVLVPPSLVLMVWRTDIGRLGVFRAASRLILWLHLIRPVACSCSLPDRLDACTGVESLDPAVEPGEGVRFLPALAHLIPYSHRLSPQLFAHASVHESSFLLFYLLGRQGSWPCRPQIVTCASWGQAVLPCRDCHDRRRYRRAAVCHHTHHAIRVPDVLVLPSFVSLPVVVDRSCRGGHAPTRTSRTTRRGRESHACRSSHRHTTGHS
jgi:hypothetical protein